MYNPLTQDIDDSYQLSCFFFLNIWLVERILLPIFLLCHSVSIRDIWKSVRNNRLIFTHKEWGETVCLWETDMNYIFIAASEPSNTFLDGEN